MESITDSLTDRKPIVAGEMREFLRILQSIVPLREPWPTDKECPSYYPIEDHDMGRVVLVRVKLREWEIENFLQTSGRHRTIRWLSSAHRVVLAATVHGLHHHPFVSLGPVEWAAEFFGPTEDARTAALMKPPLLALHQPSPQLFYEWLCFQYQILF